MSDPYAAFKTGELGDNAVGALAGLVMEYVDAQALVASCEARLDEAKTGFNDVRMKRLPDFMEANDILEQKLPSGVKVALKEELRAHVSEDRRDEAMNWLDENGHGHIIKRQVIVEFDADQEEEAREFMRELVDRPRPLSVKVKRTVHAGTLQKFLRELLEEGRPVPLKLFGVVRQKIAKVTVPKK